MTVIHRVAAPDIEQVLETLEEFGDAEGGEVGDYWQLLVELHGYRHQMSDAFRKAFMVEIFSQCRYVTANFRLERRKTTRSYETIELVDKTAEPETE